MTLTDYMGTDITARFEPEIDAESEAALRRQKLAVQVAAVRRRSRFIRRLRTVLPTAMVLLLLLNVGWIGITSFINSFNVYGGATNEIRMTNPRFVGQSGKGGHYVVSGFEAIRKGKDSQVFTLKSPAIDFQNESRGTTHVQAANGLYDLDKRTFTLTGAVTVSNGSDFSLKTEAATVDLANSVISGDKHVEGTSGLVHIEGESFVVSDSGNDIQFSGRGDVQVHTVMQQDTVAAPADGAAGIKRNDKP